MKPLLPSIIAFCLANLLAGQDTCRYDVQPGLDITYATNLSVLFGPPAEEELTMDVYEPVGDTDSLRPLAICLHGGYFFPRFINGVPIGGNRDSAVVETCRRLAEKGYVAFAPAYRLGWLPLADNYATRFSSYLQAQYRAVQDVRSCIRFLRKTVAEQGNPYRLDPNRIIVWGFGAGAIAALGAAYLDRYEELALPQFIDPELLSPYIDTAILGNPYGTTSAPLCLANHPGYSSAFNMVVNVGGAIGDSSWIGNALPGSSEPPLISYHVITDQAIPFSSCMAILQHPWLFIQTFHGSRQAQEQANRQGINEALADALADTGSLGLFLNQYANGLADEPFLFPGCQATTYATAHLYPFIPPREEGQNWPRMESNPWDWWDELATDSIISAAYPQLDAGQVLENGLYYNPDMSPEKGRAYLDTIFGYLGPRLDALWENTNSPCLVAGMETITEAFHTLSAFPNPTRGHTMLKAPGNSIIREMHLYDLLGKPVKSERHIYSPTYLLDGAGLAKGIYLARVKLDKGWGMVKVVFN